MDETFHSGDFLGLGTVEKGCGMELGRSIKPGDIIELEVEGIGILRNRMGGEAPQACLHPLSPTGKGQGPGRQVRVPDLEDGHEELLTSTPTSSPAASGSGAMPG